MKIIKFKNLNTKSNKGFTLIETLVAILILSIAFNAVITLISNSIFSAQYARNQITAMYLAQEAVDHIRNDRDSHAFEKKDLSDWTNFLDHYGSATNDKCFSRNGGCEFDATDGQYGNVFYANTLWRGPNLTYYEIDGTNGYAKNTDWKKNNHYMDDMVNIQGIYFNPGPDDIMRTTSDGNSYSSKISSDTGRLSSSGTIEFYWSKDPRYAYPNQNPNGVSTTPAIVISYKGNYANYWENPICGLHATSFGTMAYMTSPGY